MKNHLYFKNPQEGAVSYKQKPKYNPNQTEEQDEDFDFEQNYKINKHNYKRSINSYKSNKAIREKTKTIVLPEKIDLIWIKFHYIFDSSRFEFEYYRDFGLEIVTYKNWNTEAIFSVADEKKFNNFISDLEYFTDSEENILFNSNVKFIQEFNFLSSDQRVDIKNLHENIFLNLIDSTIIIDKKEIIISYLFTFLSKNQIKYNYSEDGNYIEITGMHPELIENIINNFDIIYTINSYTTGIANPNSYNQHEKGYGFDIEFKDEELPIIGIIDTGIEKNTPLDSIIINDQTYNLTNSSSFIDEIDHGTAVAAIASLGKKIYPNHIGSYKPDAKLLSIKIINESSNTLFKDDVIQLIKQANQNYGVQIFTLTIGYNNYKKYHEKHSEYCIALDKLSHELNILIFISIGNNNDYIDNHTNRVICFPELYNLESSNLFSPAESMNNITIGAYSDNFENNTINRISPAGTTPAIYSRTFHYNWDLNIFKDKNNETSYTKYNKHLFKPDIICHGGDLDIRLDPSNTGLKILSSHRGFFFNKEAGTSYSAPFAANLAAKIIHKYPALKNNMQTVKSLIINSSKIIEPNSDFQKISNYTIGHGIPNEITALNSNDDEITIILEDEILPEKLKSFALKIPGYLINLPHKTQAIIEISSTLCFSFSPNTKSEFTYCPIHLSFILANNLPLEDYSKDENGEILKNNRGIPLFPHGINFNKTDQVKVKESWSQYYYEKPKPLSNSQKVMQTWTRKILEKNIDRDGNIIIKIAVNCKLHKLLNLNEKNTLKNNPVKYSIVLNIKELPYDNSTSGRLYEELLAINNLENIITTELDLEIES